MTVGRTVTFCARRGEGFLDDTRKRLPGMPGSLLRAHAGPSGPVAHRYERGVAIGVAGAPLSIAARMRSGVNGASKTRAPTAS
jgi:hypothetical protein